MADRQYDSSEHIYQAFKAGAKGYLLKDSAGKEVVNAIRAGSSGRRYLSDRIEEIVIESYVFHKDAALRETPLDKLSDRERQVLLLVVEGKSSTEISETLFFSPKTVGNHRSRLMQKPGIRDLRELMKFAIQHGFTAA